MQHLRLIQKSGGEAQRRQNAATIVHAACDKRMIKCFDSISCQQSKYGLHLSQVVKTFFWQILDARGFGGCLHSQLLTDLCAFTDDMSVDLVRHSFCY